MKDFQTKIDNYNAILHKYDDEEITVSLDNAYVEGVVPNLKLYVPKTEELHSYTFLKKDGIYEEEHDTESYTEKLVGLLDVFPKDYLTQFQTLISSFYTKSANEIGDKC